MNLEKSGFPMKKLENADFANKANFDKFYRSILIKNEKKLLLSVKFAQYAFLKRLLCFIGKSFLEKEESRMLIIAISD
jgi:hypothetical protein